jgi:hypothetical protein
MSNDNTIIWRGKHGLLTAGTNAKTRKGDGERGYVTAILYLAPADLTPGATLCPMADKAGCKAGCLNTAGRGGIGGPDNSVQRARKARTVRFREARNTFMHQLVEELSAFVVWCAKHGFKPAVRLNGTSDIMWERETMSGGDTLFSLFPDVVFYDYTKISARFRKPLPSNYHLTMSYSRANAWFAGQAEEVLKAGGNIAVVFRDKATRARYMGETFHGFRVIDGDETDMRFLDDENVVVGLYAKGKARKDTSGFVVD